MHVACMEASGRFDGDWAGYAKWLAELVETHDVRKVSITEAAKLSRARAVAAAFGPGWKLQKSGEFLHLVRRDTFSVTLRPGAPFVTTIRRLVWWRQMHTARFQAVHKATKRRIRSLVYHAPSGVEMGDHWRQENPLQVAAHKQGMDRLGRNMRRFHALRPHVVQIAEGDSNVNHHLDEWLAYMERELGCPSVWRKYRRATKRGTHHTRLIDTANVLGDDVEVVDAFVTAKPPARLGFDHTPFVYVLDL